MALKSPALPAGSRRVGHWRWARHPSAPAHSPSALEVAAGPAALGARGGWALDLHWVV